ncbi:MAG: flagellar biosynthesis protein FlhF [Planctomycetota bacterium]
MSNTKIIQAPTIEEATARLKAELGRDAVILKTRVVKRGAFFGLGGTPVVEITATDDVAHCLEYAAAKERRRHRRIPSHAATEYGKASGAVAAPAGRVSLPDGVMRSLEVEMQALKGMMHDVLRQVKFRDMAGLPKALLSAFSHLVSSGVTEDLARDIIRHLEEVLSVREREDVWVVKDRLRDHIASLVRTGGPIRAAGGRRVVALIGPTGVGKTTTVAKLAANFKLKDHVNVGLITIDIYRIAAVEQLRKYAEIMQVPFKVVATPGELPHAIEEMAGVEIILMDTVGRGQRDHLRMNELRSYLDAGQVDEIHLVVSAATGRTTLEAVLERFGEFGGDRIIVTKTDETVQQGAILNVLLTSERKLSYVTNGQDVPKDIEVGDARRLADRILENYP